MRLRHLALALAVLAQPVGLVTTTPAAHAAGGGNVEFEVEGNLNPFPSTDGTTSFSGQGTGVGDLTGSSGGFTYNATFTMLGLPVSGYANYSELLWPVCPLVASAAQAGRITLGASSLPSVTGVVYRAGQTLTGTVTGVVISFDFTYERVGASATLVFTNGTWTVYFTTPGTGAGSFSSAFEGGGEGVFQVDPVQAESNCRANGGADLHFKLDGAALGAGADG